MGQFPRSEHWTTELISICENSTLSRWKKMAALPISGAVLSARTLQILYGGKGNRQVSVAVLPWPSRGLGFTRLIYYEVTGTCECLSLLGPTLGGGQGWLEGKYGLSLDQIVEAQVVVADGSLLTASKNSNSDLVRIVRSRKANSEPPNIKCS